MRVLRSFAEERAKHDRQEIGGVKHCTGDDHDDRDPVGCLHCPTEHEPFAQKARRRRQADQRERADREGAHRPRHPATDAIKLAHLGQVRGGVDGPGREEQSDFADCMRSEMHGCADHRDRRQDSNTEDDIRELGNGRVGEPSL